jgi:disulfide bond formation protein DsbB
MACDTGTMLSRRALNLAGFGACSAALAFAFYSQYGMGLTPCHLCIFQRVTIAALAAGFLLAALFSRQGARGVVFAFLIGLAGAATLATAGRHVWIQMQPEGTVAACGSDLAFMLDLLPVSEVIRRVFEAGGECAKIDWTFLGLSMPVWVLLFAALATVGGVWNNLRRA